MAANRGDGMAGAIARIWSRGGVFGCKHLPTLYICKDHHADMFNS